MTPYTARAIATLVENGFIEASFYVPFSASDYPKREAKRWKFLQEKAKKTPEENFSAECGEYKLKCVKSKEILIMHTFFVQERRKHEYEKNKY